MKILAVGDLVGRAGLARLKKELDTIIEAEHIDFCIVNGENVSDGKGMLKRDYEELKNLNIDVITMGNHTFERREIFEIFKREDTNLIRPANYPNANVPGNGYKIVEKNGKRICVVNLMGRAEMNIMLENPFLKATEIYEKVNADMYILDFHAEATSEKIAMGRYLDGKYSVVFGTHTHVQTADETIFECGTGYITDLGMTGPKDSVLGMKPEVAFKRFITSLPERYQIADGETILNACVFEIDDKTNKCTKVYRIYI